MNADLSELLARSSHLDDVLREYARAMERARAKRIDWRTVALSVEDTQRLGAMLAEVLETLVGLASDGEDRAFQTFSDATRLVLVYHAQHSVISEYVLDEIREMFRQLLHLVMTREGDWDHWLDVLMQYTKDLSIRGQRWLFGWWMLEVLPQLQAWQLDFVHDELERLLLRVDAQDEPLWEAILGLVNQPEGVIQRYVECIKSQDALGAVESLDMDKPRAQAAWSGAFELLSVLERRQMIERASLPLVEMVLESTSFDGSHMSHQRYSALADRLIALGECARALDLSESLLAQAPWGFIEVYGRAVKAAGDAFDEARVEAMIKALGESRRHVFVMTLLEQGLPRLASALIDGVDWEQVPIMHAALWGEHLAQLGHPMAVELLEFAASEYIDQGGRTQYALAVQALGHLHRLHQSVGTMEAWATTMGAIQEEIGRKRSLVKMLKQEGLWVQVLPDEQRW